MKKILRKIKRLLVTIFGSLPDKIYWRFRHVFEKSWADNYASEKSINHPHRKFLIEKISNYSPFNSVLEFGCASGPNLLVFSKKFPNIKIYGVDISGKAIECGEKYLRENNVNNIDLKQGGIELLKNFSDKSIDIVFSDAVLIYFDEKKIQEAISEIFRIAKKAVIFLELNKEGKSIYTDNWIHDYKNLIKRFVAEENIKISPIPKDVWNWNDFGSVIEVKL